jgi:hypothetical protein
MDRPLPPLALLLGLAGLLPFAALSLAVLAGWSDLRFALLAYGATILAFLGSVHWGFALSAGPEAKLAEPGRLVLGVLPSLIAWAALLLPLRGGLVLLALGILATAVVETVVASAGLMPRGYLRLRWGLSAGAATCLLLGSVAPGG